MLDLKTIESVRDWDWNVALLCKQAVLDLKTVGSVKRLRLKRCFAVQTSRARPEEGARGSPAAFVGGQKQRDPEGGLLSWYLQVGHVWVQWSGHPYIRLNITQNSYYLSVPSLSPPACFLPIVDYPDMVHAVEWVLKSVTVYLFHCWPIHLFLLCSSPSFGSKKGF